MDQVVSYQILFLDKMLGVYCCCCCCCCWSIYGSGDYTTACKLASISFTGNIIACILSSVPKGVIFYGWSRCTEDVCLYQCSFKDLLIYSHGENKQCNVQKVTYAELYKARSMCHYHVEAGMQTVCVCSLWCHIRCAVTCMV